MLIADDLIARIRGEYLEMPGMCLTFAQACRLWQVDPATCRAVLSTLVAEGFLQQTPGGSYAAFPGRPRTAVRATLAHRASAPRPAVRRA